MLTKLAKAQRDASRKARRRAPESGTESTFEANGESLSEALVTLLTVVLFGLGWAHLEIDRGRQSTSPVSRYSEAPVTSDTAPSSGWSDDASRLDEVAR